VLFDCGVNTPLTTLLEFVRLIVSLPAKDQ